VGENQPPTRRVTVLEAADALGVTVEAVRGRIKRGTLRSIKEGATVYVLLETDQPQPATDQPRDQPQLDSSILISRLEDEVRFLREELARKDAILLRMAESIPQLEAPAEASEAPQKAAEQPSGTTTPPDTVEGEIRRPWWRRMFGG
jgi:hypothetical protein